MKKKDAVTLSALALIFGLVLAGCASLEQKIDGALIATKWDKNEKSTAVLYFDSNVRIHAIDGKAATNLYGQATTITGDGSVRKPKVQLAIPAGERTITISYGGTGAWNQPRDAKYTFVAGRFYQLVATQNYDVTNPKHNLTTEQQIAQAEALVAGGAAAFLQAATTGEETFAMNLEVIDITGGKRRNSPSSVIVVKTWDE